MATLTLDTARHGLSVRLTSTTRKWPCGTTGHIASYPDKRARSVVINLDIPGSPAQRLTVVPGESAFDDWEV